MTAFGTTYCAISHLPIEDGDKCMLLPLVFNMQGNKLDVNSFMYLYEFACEPQEVIYEGNPDCIKYLNKEYDSKKYELYMLVHLNFYNSVGKEFEYGIIDGVNQLRLFKTIAPIKKSLEELNKKWMEDKLEELKTFKKTGSEKDRDKIMNEYMTGMPLPKSALNIYKFAIFIDGLGMIPYPNHVIDQHGKNELYEKLRAKYIKRK